MGVVLWHIELSHYNEKARWALDYKRIPHVRRVPMPGLHGFRALLLTRGKQRRLPVIEIDGRRTGDSTAIIAALEEYKPEPPLYPAEVADRKRALELEDWFDENLAPPLRRFVWHQLLADDDNVVAALFTRPNRTRERLIRTMAPIAKAGVRRDFHINDETARQARADVIAAMDRLESELGPSGYLVGDGFTVADLTAAALFTPVVAPALRPYVAKTAPPAMLELREELSARSGGIWIHEMYARHRGHSAESREPAAALAARPA
jgi:glutathione S-transferase